MAILGYKEHVDAYNLHNRGLSPLLLIYIRSLRCMIQVY